MSDPLLVFQKGRDLLEQELRSHPHRAAWPEGIARTLRALWPDARLCYCRLDAGLVCALDDSGATRPAWAAALEDSVSTWLAVPEEAAPETLVPPSTLDFSDPIPVARLCGAETVLGAAAVAFPARFTPEESLWAAVVLNELAAQAGLRLQIEAARDRERSLLQEREQQTAQCILADMVGPFSHEMQNVFNNIVLQAAIVTREVTEEVRADIDVMRRMGLQASAMMSQLDDYRYRLPLVRRPIDLNTLVASFLAQLPDHAVKVEADLAPDLPPVAANESDLCRLLRLLVGNARAVLAVHGSGAVTVRTRRQGAKVLLVVEDTGPGLGEDPGKVFEPLVEARPGENSLERAACLGLVRRLKGTIRAESPGNRGLFVTVELEAM